MYLHYLGALGWFRPMSYRRVLRGILIYPYFVTIDILFGRMDATSLHSIPLVYNVF